MPITKRSLAIAAAALAFTASAATLALTVRFLGHRAEVTRSPGVRGERAGGGGTTA